MTPAATAEPITPATLGPIACINKKFCGLAFKPTRFDTRAAIGTADTPAEPINGLIGVLDTLFINLAINTPQAVPMAARVSNRVGLNANPQNFLLMHAMGPNVAGVIGSAVAAGVMISLVGG